MEEKEEEHCQVTEEGGGTERGATLLRREESVEEADEGDVPQEKLRGREKGGTRYIIIFDSRQ